MSSESELKESLGAAQRLRRWRYTKDRLARVSIAVGGMGVIVAILLIFVYLLLEVLPLFRDAEIDSPVITVLEEVPDSAPLYLQAEEQLQQAIVVYANGQAAFVDLRDGKTTARYTPGGSEPVAAIAADRVGGNWLALGLASGRAVIVEQAYGLSWENDVKTVVPELAYPLGEAPLNLVDGTPSAISLHRDDDELTLAAIVDNHLTVREFVAEENFLTGELQVEETAAQHIALPVQPAGYQALHVSNDGRWYFAVASRAVQVIDMRSGKLETVPYASNITQSAMLLGSLSLLIGDAQGGISQWFFVRQAEGEPKLTRIRDFQVGDQPIVKLFSEHRRKSFVAIDSEGRVGLINTTAENVAFDAPLPGGAADIATIGPRGNALLMLRDNTVLRFPVHNEHPDISLSVLWGKVWYESYAEPAYIWQSSAASNDFEPKFSLMPLVFGTLKAAFYAMVIAMPLAIMGAVYTAYFMAPSMRQLIKPTIELMEALPTVILGFLAGLWLAPLVETMLPGIFLTLLLLPITMLLASWLFTRLPADIRHAIPDGWQPVLLLPVVILTVFVAMRLSAPIEAAFFAGNMPQWLANEAGIPFDQRNALVVGLAMGFAVIPTIFSIAEDALFAVPRHLTFGSLALGATPWQTLMRVVLPTASPGIFSAVMIGFGRAVGETMIVLMATGNTPVMEWNIFEGLRTLSANIAVEMPEAEVASTHYRILFLAALVLFVFTFVFNTAAELIRHRLRKQYGSL